MRQSYDERRDRDFMQAFVIGQLGSSDLVNNEAVNKPIKKENITGVGRILRKSSLDEVPQIINVLKGEMSFVGPRPNVPWEVEKYQDWHCKRLEVLPGITGLAQVRGRSNISFDEIVYHDIEYVQKQSLAEPVTADRLPGLVETSVCKLNIGTIHLDQARFQQIVLEVYF